MRAGRKWRQAFRVAEVACAVTRRKGNPESYAWASLALVTRNGNLQPFRFAAGQPRPRESDADAIRAEWTARMANNLAAQMQILGPEGESSILKEKPDPESAELEKLSSAVEQAR